jgi:hypothetical protein
VNIKFDYGLKAQHNYAIVDHNKKQVVVERFCTVDLC